MNQIDKQHTIDLTDPSFKKVDLVFAIVISPIILFLAILPVKMLIDGYIPNASYQLIILTLIGMVILFMVLTLIHEGCHWLTAKIFGIPSKIKFQISLTQPAYVSFKKGQIFTKRAFLLTASTPFIISLLLIIFTITFSTNYWDYLYVILLVLLTQFFNLPYCGGDISFIIQAIKKVKNNEQNIIYVGTDEEHKYIIK